MTKPEWIAEGVCQVGGPEVSRADDATVFIVDGGDELAMIDSGAGRSVRRIEENIRGAGLDPSRITQLILTHCHIDHIGGAPHFRERFGCRILIHALDAEAVETGDPKRTAASWYDTDFPPTKTDGRLTGAGGILPVGNTALAWVHTPGHTPGSICLYLDRGDQRILFGQDIHGPFLAAFGSDLAQWRRSMDKLLALHADILCEGHFGIFRTKPSVQRYIQRTLDQNR
jgi:glyoxylase-like metal-dependent hydrolase (beta-lactamase superfamily II)